MDYDVFLRILFPDGMFDYFNLVDFIEKPDKVEIYLEEKNEIPQKYADDKFESKGFYKKVFRNDYHMRGRSCFLYIKKRRWYNHT